MQLDVTSVQAKTIRGRFGRLFLFFKLCELKWATSSLICAHAEHPRFVCVTIMLRITRFTAGKLAQKWSVPCIRREGLHQLSSRTVGMSWKRQVFDSGRGARNGVCFVPVYVRKAPYQHAWIRLGVGFVRQAAWPHCMRAVAFFSSSTDSQPDQQNQVQTNSRSSRVPSDDLKKLLQLAHPERWRLTGTFIVKPRLGFQVIFVSQDAYPTFSCSPKDLYMWVYVPKQDGNAFCMTVFIAAIITRLY